VPFAIRQVRLAVYPQLEAISTGSYQGGVAGVAPAAPGVQMQALDEARMQGSLAAGRQFKRGAAAFSG
jgi:hypothetical protein